MVVKVNITSINGGQHSSRGQQLAGPHETLSLKAGQNLRRTTFSQIFSVRLLKLREKKFSIRP